MTNKHLSFFSNMFAKFESIDIKNADIGILQVLHVLMGDKKTKEQLMMAIVLEM